MLLFFLGGVFNFVIRLRAKISKIFGNKRKDYLPNRSGIPGIHSMGKGKQKDDLFWNLDNFVQDITFIWKGSRWFDHLIEYMQVRVNATIHKELKLQQLLVRWWNTVDGSLLAITHLGCKKSFVNSRRAFIPGGATPYFRHHEYGRLPWPIPFLKSCCIRNRTLTLRLAGGRLSFVKETKDPMGWYWNVPETKFQ